MVNGPKPTKPRASQPGASTESSAPCGSARTPQAIVTESLKSSELAEPVDASRTRGPVPPEPSQLSSTTTESHGALESNPPSQEAGVQDQETQGTQPPDEDDRQISLGKLESIITQCRDRQITKTTALSGIISVIIGLSISESENEKTIKLYTEELDSIRYGGEPIISSGSGKKRLVDDAARGLDRASVVDNSVDGSEGADSDDPDRPRKRTKLTAADFPWFESDGQSLLTLSASSIQTCKHLATYNQDIPGCKFQVRIAPKAPRGIPVAQWERIFRGETLDLDHFLSSLHRTTVDEAGETRIGNAKISFGITEAKRKVSTASDWASAWRLAAKAVVFAFPHRSEELSAYGDFIDGEFQAKQLYSHPRVIMFDIAIRNLVQGGQTCLLTDHQTFSRLYSAILMPDGAESAPKRGASTRRSNPSSRASGSKPDICNRFNTSFGCPSTDSDCRYRHICKGCKKGGHGKDQCPK